MEPTTIERFTLPPDAKARLAMREGQGASRDSIARRPLAGQERTGADSPRSGDDCEAAPSDIG